MCLLQILALSEMANFLVPSIPNLESCRYKVDHVIGQIWNHQEPTIHQWMPEA
jgi:hypothetical protein